MIEISDVSFSYSKKQKIFNQLDLQLESGKIYGLLGKNGAGKSTLLKLLSGFIQSSKGIIKVNDFNPFERNPEFYRKLFYLPEEIEYTNLTISDFITSLSGFYPNFNMDKMNALIKDFELDHKNKIGELSFGQRKKIFLSFGFAAGFKVLLLDEPTIGLDITAKTTFRKTLAEEINDDKLIVLSTHQIEDIDKLLDHIIILDKGKVQLDTSLDEISNTVSFHQISKLNGDDNILFKQKTPLGYDVIVHSPSNSNDINIPALYNAVLTERAFTLKLNELLTKSR